MDRDLRRVVIWGFQRVANFDSEPVGVFGADRCDAMGCVTINGSGSETFCRAVRGRLVGQRGTIGFLSRLCSTAIGPGSRGGTCRSVLGMGSRCSDASAAGPSPAFGNACSSTSPQRLTMNMR